MTGAWAPNPLLVNVVYIAFLLAVAVLVVRLWPRAGEGTTVDEPVYLKPPLEPDVDEQVAGLALYRLLAFPEEWVNRRVETIQILDADTARRRVSVDFQLPERLFGIDVLKALDVVPITLMAKGPLRGFDIFDEDQRSLPVASAARGVSMGQSALLMLAQELLGDKPLDEAVRADLLAVPGGDRDLTKLHAERMELAADDSFAAALVRVADFAPRPEWNPWLQRIELMADDVFAALVRDLTVSYLLAVDVPPEPGKRRIFKFVYEHRFRFRNENAAIWLAGRMGWITTGLQFTTPAASKARSYHCEVEAPPQLEITCAKLRAVREGPVVDEESGGLSSAHLHTSRLSLRSGPVVDVWLRSSRLGFLRPALLTGLLTCAILWAGRLRLPEITGEVEAASTFLVLVPALLAAYLAQPGEHEISSAMRSGVRVALAGSGACAVVAGALLVAHLPRHALLFGWTIVTFVSTWCLLLLLVADRLPITRRSGSSEAHRRGLPL